VVYRDDAEALRERVSQLEAELAELRRPRGPGGGGNVFLGAPTRLVFEDEVDVELDERSLERLVSILRRELGTLGRIERVGDTLAWVSSVQQGQRYVELICEVRDGRTMLRLQESLGQVAGGLFGGVVGGAGGGGLGFVIPLSLVFGAPALTPLFALGWVGAVYAATRAGYKRLAKTRGERLGALMNRLVAEARRATPRVRVGTEEDPLQEDELVEEDTAAVSEASEERSA